MSKIMRISDSTAQNLDELAKATGDSKQALLERAVQAYVRKQFIKKANEDYAELKKDPKAWAELQKEQEEWNITLSDGLNDE